MQGEQGMGRWGGVEEHEDPFSAASFSFVFDFNSCQLISRNSYDFIKIIKNNLGFFTPSIVTLTLKDMLSLNTYSHFKSKHLQDAFQKLTLDISITTYDQWSPMPPPVL